MIDKKYVIEFKKSITYFFD